MRSLIPVPKLLLAGLAGGLSAGCADRAVEIYCADRGYTQSSAAFQQCVGERQSDRRLRYLRGGRGAGAGG